MTRFEERPQHRGRLGLRLARARRSVLRAGASWFATVNPAPVIVLGNQKSGTTVIASLLAEASGLSAAIDLQREVECPTFHHVMTGRLSFDAFVERNKLDFSRDLVKAPDLTPLFDDVQKRFPSARFVFVVRDPRDNIRSILDRLGLPGDGPPLSRAQWQAVPRGWQLVLDGSWLGLEDVEGAHYVEHLAVRWNYFVDVALRHRERFTLCRYEDFCRDKSGELRRLAASLGLDPSCDVSERLDVQFQSRGVHRETEWSEFFGARLQVIEMRCAHRMAELGYDMGSVGGESR